MIKYFQKISSGGGSINFKSSNLKFILREVGNCYDELRIYFQSQSAIIQVMAVISFTFSVSSIMNRRSGTFTNNFQRVEQKVLKTGKSAPRQQICLTYAFSKNLPIGDIFLMHKKRDKKIIIIDEGHIQELEFTLRQNIYDNAIRTPRF
ncbi:hypothetical protein pb186bvf_005013 [Paramecium bursaria]